MAEIIAGFAGVGKTTLLESMPKGSVVDLDSGRFCKSKFPLNYTKHLEMLDFTFEGTILVSTHREVLEYLRDNKKRYTLVYPCKNLWFAYKSRYSDRGSRKDFIDYVDENWSSWIKDLDDWDDKYCTKIKLKNRNETLTDVYADIMGFS